MIICHCLLVRFNHLFLSTKMQAEIVGDIFCFRVEFSSHVERSGCRQFHHSASRRSAPLFEPALKPLTNTPKQL